MGHIKGIANLQCEFTLKVTGLLNITTVSSNADSQGNMQSD